MKEIETGIEEKIRLLGRRVSLHGKKGKRETWAIIDPVDSVSKAARSAEALPDGYFPPGSYQYFGLKEGDLSEVDTVTVENEVYFLRRKELYTVAGRKIYWWALMIRGGQDDAEA